ncbi:MAG TPA: S53 family peptidase [Acidimicrobiales bacterium]|nr:S53 family peptidase [Acidimicrobiales bacterium]
MAESATGHEVPGWRRVALGSRRVGAACARARRVPAGFGAVALALLAGAALPAVARAPGAGRPPSASAAWHRLLEASTDLGPSRARIASVVMALAAGAPGPGPVRRWAASAGLAVRSWPGERFAIVLGSPARLGRALRVRIDDFRARSGERFYASVRAPAIPPALARTVAGLGRISSYGQPVAAYVPAGGLTPTGLRTAYDAGPLLERGIAGAGETVVLFEDSPYSPSDLAAFARRFGLPPFDVQVVNGQGAFAAEMVEADMDLETVHEIAPLAHLVYYNIGVGLRTTYAEFATALTASFADAAQRFPGAIWSISLAACEKVLGAADLAAMEDAVAAAAARGTTAYASSGDQGGADCLQFGEDSVSPGEGVDFPADLPAVTGVGGTTLDVTTRGDYLGEEAWTLPMLSLGTGGGVSTLVPRPAWQPTALGAGPSGREVPDVSAVADVLTGNAIVVHGQPAEGSGTSLAAPVWAGLTALVDEFLVRSGARPLGFANPAFYALGAERALEPPPFHDVVVGGNDFYRATPGYDLATGLGSPDTAVLAQDLLAYERASR